MKKIKFIIILFFLNLLSNQLNAFGEDFLSFDLNWKKSSFTANKPNSLEFVVKNETKDYNIRIDSIVLANPRWNIDFAILNLPVDISPNGNTDLSLSKIQSKHNLQFNLRFYVYYTIKDLNTSNVSLINFFPSFAYDDAFEELTFNKFGLDLKNILKQYLQNHAVLSYRDAREKMFGEIDNFDGIVECVYTGRKIETKGIPDISQTGFNTEHTWPQSMFNEGDTASKSDIFHLYPTDETANNKRASYPFDYVTQIQWQNGGSKLGKNSKGETVFEPRDEKKGNIARSLFYFALRYDNPKQFLNSQEKTLREFCILDPVDSLENERNNKIFTIQQRYNPFISHPEYLDRIYSIAQDENFPVEEKIVISTNYAILTPEFINTAQKYSIFITNAGNITLDLTEIEKHDENGGLIGKIGVQSLPISIPADSVLTIATILKDIPEEKKQKSTLVLTINNKKYIVILEENSFSHISQQQNNSLVYFSDGTLNVKSDDYYNQIEIFDILGNKLHFGMYEQTNISLPLSLNRGVYFVILRDNVNISSHKIIISN